jgi:hypothetical protein
MKKLILTLVAAVALLTVNINAADTNTVALEATEEVGKSEAGGYEFTLGGSGETLDGESSYGLDFSISTNPLESAPNVWFGLVQGLYWEPKISGSTDINVNYSQHLFKELYVNVGWSAGVVYARGEDEEGVKSTDYFFRTGPEVTFQNYVGDNAFIYAGVNYDLKTWREEGASEGGFRYSFGVGLSF